MFIHVHRFMICSVTNCSLAKILDFHSPTYQHFISSVVQLGNVWLLRLVSYTSNYILVYKLVTNTRMLVHMYMYVR